MNIKIEPRRSLNVHGHRHRLCLDNYYQDLTHDDLIKLAVEALDAVSDAEAKKIWQARAVKVNAAIKPSPQAGYDKLGESHCSDHWSPGVRKAMAAFEEGLAARRQCRADELGLPWHVAPWGDGSRPLCVNICSESHGTVIAADLERETANLIVSIFNDRFIS